MHSRLRTSPILLRAGIRDKKCGKNRAERKKIAHPISPATREHPDTAYYDIIHQDDTPFRHWKRKKSFFLFASSKSETKCYGAPDLRPVSTAVGAPPLLRCRNRPFQIVITPKKAPRRHRAGPPRRLPVTGAFGLAVAAIGNSRRAGSATYCQSKENPHQGHHRDVPCGPETVSIARLPRPGARLRNVYINIGMTHTPL